VFRQIPEKLPPLPPFFIVFIGDVVVCLKILDDALGNCGVEPFINEAFPITKNEFTGFYGGKTCSGARSTTETAENRSFDLWAPRETFLNDRASNGIPASG
jgi:hypothetical protein